MKNRYYRPLAVVTATAALASVGLTTASAEPGHPGTPSAPTIVFHEDFENAPHSGDRTMLNQYAGGVYTADAYWLSAPMANGLVLSWNNTRKANDGTGADNGTEATAFAVLKQLSEAIGKVNGTANPQNNMAISAYTQSDGTAPAGNKVMFKTVNESLKVKDGTGRFLAFSMSAAAANCKSASFPQRQDPQYKLYVVQNGVETALSTTPINPCTDARAQSINVSKVGTSTVTAVKAGVFASDNSFLYDGESFGFVVRNGTSAHLGNDGAFDDITVLDVTPQLDKSFGAESATVGDAVRLTLTVTNTSELAQKDGWSFTDSLPAGMVVAADPELTVDGNASVTADPGARSIVVSNGSLDAGDSSLTISVNVTAAAAGEYTNGSANITARRGIDAPDTATVRFVDREDPTPAPAELTVRHIDVDGKSLADDVTSAGTVGEKYGTEARSFEGYELVATPTNASGEYAAEPTTVTYVYRKVEAPAPLTGELVVRYVDESGNPVAEGYGDEGLVGEGYTTSAKEVGGYELIATPVNASGKLVEGTTEVVYVYRKVEEPVPGPAALTVRYIDESDNPVAEGYSTEGTIGDNYSTDAKMVGGYELIATPTNASGEFVEGITEVVYVYRKVEEPAPAIGALVVRYIDTSGNPVAEGYSNEGTVGEHYATEAKTIEGYDLIAVPTNATGDYVNGTTEVVYVYTKVQPAVLPADLTVKFVDEKGKELATPQHSTGVRGEDYSTAPATIKGYELVAVPANASGTMVPGTEVIYVYRPIAKADPAPTPEPTVDPTVDPSEEPTPVPPPPATHAGKAPKSELPSSLSGTGAESTAMGAIAALLALGGMALVIAGRRREQ